MALTLYAKRQPEGDILDKKNGPSEWTRTRPGVSWSLPWVSDVMSMTRSNSYSDGFE